MKKLILLFCIISWSYYTNAQCDGSLPVTENFNNVNAVNSCWDFIDSDGDGYNWYVSSISGNNALVSESYTLSTGYLTPDNWAITYAIDLKSYNTSSNIQLTWRVRASSWSFDKERYTVYAATGNQITDFTSSTVSVFEDLDDSDASGTWGSRSLDLSSLAGNIVYIAYRHHLSAGQREIEIDDIQISTDSSGGGSGCIESIANFNGGSLSGSNSSTLTLPYNSKDALFSISGLDTKTKGKQDNQYIENVNVSYIDGSGVSQIYGTYSGNEVNSATININGQVRSITVGLSDELYGNSSSGMSIYLSDVTYCSSSSICSDDDNDGVCNANDLCAGTPPNTIVDNKGCPVSSGCQEITDSFNGGTLSGSNSATLFLPDYSKDASFTISNLDARTKGKQSNQYIEFADVSYVDGSGVSHTYGSYSGDKLNSASIYINGNVSSITVSLSDNLNSSSNISINLSDVIYCVSSSSSAKTSTSKIYSQDLIKNESLSTINDVIAKSMKIYPNPASKTFFLKGIEISNYKIIATLYNIAGIKVRSYNLSGEYNQTHKMDINGISTGLYLLQIMSERGELLKTERIVIN